MKATLPRSVVLALALVMAVAVFFIDTQTTRSFAEWILYLAPVVIAAEWSGRRDAYLMALVCTIFILLSFLVAPLGSDPAIAWLSRALQIVVLWLVTLLLARQITLETKVKQQSAEFEQKLKERTAEFQDLYENAPVGYHSLDGNGKILMVNQTERNWFGYSREEMIGRPFIDFLAPLGKVKFEKEFLAFKERGYVRELEFEVVRKDGTTLPIYVNGTATYDQDGNFLSTRSTIFDGTQRKQAEAQLRLQSSLLAAIGQAVIVTDLEGKIFYWNDAATEMYGWQRDEVIGRPIQEVTVPEMSLDQANSIMAALQAGKEWEGEFVVRRRDGSTFWALVLDTPFYDIAGQFSGVIGISTDISARKQAEDTALLAAGEMERALRLKDEFLANMSHELRTPLNSILTLCEALHLQVYGSLTERQQQALGMIEDSGQHLLELINDVLDLSKIAADRLDLHMEPVNIEGICQASLSFTKELAHKKQIKLAYENTQPGIVLCVDVRRLKQILVNLLSNAVKFTPNGGFVRLSVTTDPEKEVVRFSVEDTGIGIKAEDMPKLFQPFSQIDSSLSRQHEGTGLGLALVKSLVTQQGGAVQVESAGIPGQGSCFTVILPYQTDNLTEETQLAGNSSQAAAGVEAQDETPSGTANVLVVEDNEVNSEVLASYLRVLGYQVTTAHNGIEGLELAQMHSPQLVLVDIQMPVMDGFEVIRRLRTNPIFTSTPIVAMTALAMVGDRERCLEAGATEYVSKPIGMKALADLMSRLLQAV